MDLTRLYNLTTPELREEAERLGVSDTYAMSRGQLIHAIRNQVSGAQPDGFLGKVLGFAKWALQAAQEEPRKETEAQPPRGRDPVAKSVPETVSVPGSVPGSGSAPVSAPVSVSEPVTVPVTAPVSASGPAPVEVPVSVPGPAPVEVPASEPGPAPVEVPASVSEPVTVPVSVTESAASDASGSGAASESVSEEPAESASGPPGRPPVGVFSNSASMFEEPFPTRTMARILADQGHFKRSLAIYATLLRDEPGNGELCAEADEVRAQSRARRSEVH